MIQLLDFTEVYPITEGFFFNAVWLFSNYSEATQAYFFLLAYHRPWKLESSIQFVIKMRISLAFGLEIGFLLTEAIHLGFMTLLGAIDLWLAAVTLFS